MVVVFFFSSSHENEPAVKVPLVHAVNNVAVFKRQSGSSGCSSRFSAAMVVLCLSSVSRT